MGVKIKIISSSINFGSLKKIIITSVPQFSHLEDVYSIYEKYNLKAKLINSKLKS